MTKLTWESSLSIEVLITPSMIACESSARLTTILAHVFVMLACPESITAEHFLVGHVANVLMARLRARNYSFRLKRKSLEISLRAEIYRLFQVSRPTNLVRTENHETAELWSRGGNRFILSWWLRVFDSRRHVYELRSRARLRDGLRRRRQRTDRFDLPSWELSTREESARVRA